MALNLNRLNERQREAVLHGEGPLLILAGAGSGKTSTMTYRIAHLISERNIPAMGILGLSFTRKASLELKERVKKLVTEVSGPRATEGLWITTFHSLCVRILRAYGEKLGYQKNFTILDQSDQTDIIRQILRQIKIDERKFDPDSILFEIGQAKNRFLTADQTREFLLDSRRLPSDYAIAAVSCYERYVEHLRALSAMDFDDLIFNTVRLLEQHEDVRQIYNDRFRHVLVDEYQDTNPAQSRLLKLLTERRQNICVVGDDDQSIYAWRGADATHILKFTEHYPGARMITLDQNYRSTSTILDAANQVIAQNKVRHSKTLWSDRGTGEPIRQILVEEDRAEAEMVAEEILRLARKNHEGQTQQLRPWKDFAILYRSNPQSRLFEEALRMRQIPYKLVGALSFLDRKEIKDTLCYWRAVINFKDDASVRRVINWPARGVGKSAMDTLNTYALEQGLSFYEALPECHRIAPRAVAGATAFRAVISELRQSLEATPADPVALAAWGRKSLEVIGIKKALEEESDDPVQFARKWENIEEICNALGQLNVKDILAEEREALATATVSGAIEVPQSLQINGTTLLREFIARMTLNAMDEQEDDKKKDSKDQVTLLTLHGAKGLEYPVVFLVGMEEGFLPHRRTIEEAQDFSEERRLCYVGITRARDQLILTRAKNRIRYGKAVPRSPSRFLEEIPQELIVTQDESHTPDLTSKEAQEAHETKVKDFLSQIRAQLAGQKPL